MTLKDCHCCDALSGAGDSSPACELEGEQGSIDEEVMRRKHEIEQNRQQRGLMTIMRMRKQ